MSDLPNRMFGLRLDKAEVMPNNYFQNDKVHKLMCRETIKSILNKAQTECRIPFFTAKRYYAVLAECSISEKWSMERVRRETVNIIEMQMAGELVRPKPIAPPPPRIILRNQEEHEKGEWKEKDLVPDRSEDDWVTYENNLRREAEESWKKKTVKPRNPKREYPMVVRFDEESITRTKALAKAARREIRKKRAIAKSRARAARKGKSEHGSRKRTHTSTSKHSEDPMMENRAETSTEIPAALSSANCVSSDTDIKTKIANIYAKISELSVASSLSSGTNTTTNLANTSTEVSSNTTAFNTKSSFVTYSTYKRPHSSTTKPLNDSGDKKRRKISTKMVIPLEGSSMSSDDNTMTSNDSIDVVSA